MMRLTVLLFAAAVLIAAVLYAPRPAVPAPRFVNRPTLREVQAMRENILAAQAERNARGRALLERMGR